MSILRTLRADGWDPDEINEIEATAQRFRNNEYARDLQREWKANQIGWTLPHVTPLVDFHTIYSAKPQFTVEGLLPKGGTALLVGPEKAGKSHMVANLMRALADGTPFLGRYETKPRKVLLIDLELNESTLSAWLREQQIQHPEQVGVIALKGQASSFNILDPAVRAKWADIIMEAEPDFLIIDCLWPILAALDLDENKDAGRFLVAFDELKYDASVDDAVVLHHTGHNGRGPRGDSKMKGWADALWEIEREDPADPQSNRYFSAYGRDVSEQQQQLIYDHDTRALTLAEVTRKEAKLGDTLQAVVTYLNGTADETGRTGRAVRDALATQGHADPLIREALKEAERRGITTTKPGPRRATIHTMNPSGMSGIQCDEHTANDKSVSVLVGSIQPTHTHSSHNPVGSDSPSHSNHHTDRSPLRAETAA